MQKTRKSFSKEITRFVKSGNLGKVEQLCEYGRTLSNLECFFSRYYDALDDMEAAMKDERIFAPFIRKAYHDPVNSEEFKKLEKKLKDAEKWICHIFLEAVKNHDGKKIIELAKSVMFFKDKRLPARVPADRERSTMIAMKELLDYHGQKLPIRTLAEFLAMEAKAAGKKFEVSPDGFSALRRKCKEMNFPLAESRKRKK